MIPTDGCCFLSCHELANTRKGKLVWEKYIRQIVNISLQHPDHFFPSSAQILIPKDAERHQLYVHLENGDINAFCIVAIYCNIAEYLWVATRKEVTQTGIMRQLYWFIEDRIRDEEPEVERIISMCASLDSKIVEDDSLADSEKVRRRQSWQGTHIFHHKMNFDFTYKLEDYWEVGYHALVCMKVRANFGVRERKYCSNYGYSLSQSPPSSISSQGSKILPRKGDENLAINEKIQEHVRACLDAFDESFVRNAQPGATGEESYILKENSNDSREMPDLKLKGITGLALLNPNNKIATVFAHTSKDDLSCSNASKVEFINKFEYDSRLPGFLNQIIEEKDEVGYLIHPASLSEKSEINLHTYFNRYYANDKEDNYQGDYTVFYRRRVGKDNFCSILYFATPLIPNILWYKKLWQSFSDYSFALILVILGYLSSLKVLDSSLRNNKYFDGLIKAVSPSSVDDDFAGKIARISEDITQQTDSHYAALVNQKKGAFRNSGHLMRNRCDNLLRLLRLDPQVQLSSSSPLYKGLDDLSDTYQAQQLCGFETLDEILDEYKTGHLSKLSRFIETGDSVFDLSNFLYEEASLITEVKDKFNNHEEFFVSLDVKQSKSHRFYLEPALSFSEAQQVHFRLSKSVLSNIFFEIFLNVARHGMVNLSSEGQNRRGRGTVSVYFKKGQIDDATAIVITNPVFISDDKYNARDKFERFPMDRFREVSGDLGNGLSGIAEYMSRLKLGKVGVRRFRLNDQDFYGVAVSLKGLKIVDVDQE